MRRGDSEIPRDGNLTASLPHCGLLVALRASDASPRVLSVAFGSRNDDLELHRVAQLGDDPERALDAGDAIAIVEGVAPALRVVVPGRTGGVRAEDRVLQGEEPMI